MKHKIFALCIAVTLLTISRPTVLATPSSESSARHSAQSSEISCSHYLAPNGSDNNSGSINFPWATISHASQQLQPGDTLCARGGTYYGQGGYIWNSTSGTSSAPITFTAYPGETPIFDGEWSQGEFLVLNGVHWIVVSGLAVRHYDDEWGNGAILISGNTKHITIRDMHMYDNGTHYNQDHHIYIGAGEVEDVTITRCLLENPASGNIHTWHGPSVNGLLITNNVIQGGHWGIILNDGAQNIEIYNNTIYDCDIGLDFSLSGEDTSWGVANVAIHNNIIRTLSGQRGMSVGSFNSNDIESDYNLWYGVSEPILWSGASYSISEYRNTTGNATHSLYDYPSFVVPTTDFSLQPDSPAIDAGKTLSEVQLDYEQSERPAGDSYDIGAYENDDTSTPSTPTPTTNPTSTPTPTSTSTPTPDPTTGPTATPSPTPSPITWEAQEGNISDPFVATQNYVAQSITTAEDPTRGGRAAFRFSLPRPGNYIIQVIVNAPTIGSNSFFINIDEEPHNPSMVWDIEITDGFQERTVSWRGSGTHDINEFAPKVFMLSAGEHELIIRGREEDTLLDQIRLVSTEATQSTLYLPLLFNFGLWISANSQS